MTKDYFKKLTEGYSINYITIEGLTINNLDNSLIFNMNEDSLEILSSNNTPLLIVPYSAISGVCLDSSTAYCKYNF